jgi:hypothetical protein
VERAYSLGSYKTNICWIGAQKWGCWTSLNHAFQVAWFHGLLRSNQKISLTLTRAVATDVAYGIGWSALATFHDQSYYQPLHHNMHSSLIATSGRPQNEMAKSCPHNALFVLYQQGPPDLTAPMRQRFNLYTSCSPTYAPITEPPCGKKDSDQAVTGISKMRCLRLVLK